MTLLLRAVPWTGWALGAILVLAAAGCAPTHAGRTVGRGVLQAEGSLGGPLVRNLGPPIPVPNVPVGARYGLTDRLDVSGHVNLLPLVAGGFLAMDGGLTLGLVRHKGRIGPNLATSAGFVLLTDFDTAARVGPLVDMAASYTFDWLTPFVGLEIIPDPRGGRVVTDVFAGLEADFGRTSVSLAGVWFHPSFDVSASPVEYVSLDNRGALGVLLGVKVRWNMLDLRCKEGRDGR
ncbi:MAG: hypothetical protein PHU25_02915 [Deltaproteobacteria bacterium]|nr:hypothetical protein [Deltaproteobacteria bacterium]